MFALPRCDRREFLAGAAGLTVGLTAEAQPPGEEVAVAPLPRPVEMLPPLPTPRDTLLLTWQRDPTTTMTLQWLSYDATPQVIRYCEVTKNPTGEAVPWRQQPSRTKPFGPTPVWVHRCELTGLTPGGEYVFQIGNHFGLYRFRTMPAKANDAIPFVSGGDCGIQTPAVASNILAAKQEPYFALIGGDLGYDNGLSARTAITFLMNYSTHMVDRKGRLIPLIAAIGNHEVRGGYRGSRADAPYFLAIFDGLFPERTYNVLDCGDYLSLVLLDTHHIAPIDGEQTTWLAEVLRERQERPHLLVVNHVPAYPSVRQPEGLGRFGGTGALNRKHWCPLFERYRVDAVLEHHDHVYKRTHPLTDGLRDRYGVPYLGDGSWGKLRTPAPIEKRPYLLRSEKTYHISVHRLEGERRYHIALDETGRVADVYASEGKRPARRG